MTHLQNIDCTKLAWQLDASITVDTECKEMIYRPEKSDVCRSKSSYELLGTHDLIKQNYKFLFFER